MISNELARNIIGIALSTGGDFAEIFIEEKVGTNLFLIDNKLEKALSGNDLGLGLRVFKGLYSTYVYTNDLSKESLLNIAREAAFSIDGNPNNQKIAFLKRDIENRNKILINPNEVEKRKKVDLMKAANNYAREYDPVISQAKVSYLDQTQNITIFNSEGLYATDTRVRTRFSIESIATRGTSIESGAVRPGASKGFEFFDELDLKALAREASRMAKLNLTAEHAPSGSMPVIIESKFGGVIFHEACGHGLEATSVAKGNSVFTDRIGEQVASPLVSAVDDGTIPNHWGSSNIDDEGEPTRRNLLIDKGILKGYLIDKLNGRRMGKESTGSGRRQSYRFAPTSRMTNTFILNGTTPVEEMVGSTETGVYAKTMGGGSVNPATGEFNFAIMEGYLIKNGQITTPLKGATLIGNGPDVLKKITMVGDNLGYGQGMCGSLSGSIPTNVGQPAIKVSELTIGGRK